MRLGTTKHLDAEDLWDVARWNEASFVYRRYEAQLLATSSAEKYPHGSVWTALVKAFGPKWALAGIVKFVHDCANLSSPVILRQLLLHLQASGSQEGALAWAFALFASGSMVPLLINQYFYMVTNTCLFLKASLIQALYQKALRISLASRGTFGHAAIVNLQSNDAAKVYNLPQYGHVLWSGPFQVAVIIYALHAILGWPAALAGFSVTVLLVPTQTAIGRVVARLRKDLIAKTEARVKIMSEIVGGIKAIKLYAWEAPYTARLATARAAERAAIRRVQVISCINSLMFLGGPILVALAAFATYASLGHDVTAAVAFPSLALFDLLRFPIIMLPMQVMNFINARVAIRRLQAFMNADEAEPQPRSAAAVPSSSGGEAAITVYGGDFAWAPSAPPTLTGIRLALPAGALAIVVGEVGCGKSTLLAAILGEVPRRAGNVTVRGRIAYTAQDPWIQNDTVKGNILMGSALDEARYGAVLDACALRTDLAMLPAGDQTEIGEKGVNLSGGQKHRVALARACYADADVYLLDDPLSAVDAHVGRHLMSECVMGLLARRTRILVTHQLQFLPEADVVVMMESGRVAHVGSHAELVARGISFADFVLERADEEGAAEGEGVGAASSGGQGRPGEGSPSDPGRAAPAAGPEGSEGEKGARGGGEASRVGHAAGPANGKVTRTGALIGKEDRSKGKVSSDVYWNYLRSWGPGLLMPVAFLSIAFTERGLQVTQNFWLSVWSEATLEWEPEAEASAAGAERFPTTFYMTVYFALGLSSLVFQISRALILVFSTLHASQAMHDALLAKLMSLPMSFFDQQPSGRILNRFTKDVEACDIGMQHTISSFTTCLVSVAMSVLVVLAVTRGAVVAALVPLALVYRAVQQYYLATSRELKRLDSISTSPIISNFSETVAGLVTVRAFARQDAFAAKQCGLVDASSRAWWPIQVVNRWLSLRLEVMGQCVVLGTAVAVTLLVPDAGLAGLALTSALSLVSLMNWATRQGTELEMAMNSVERMLEYLGYESEAPAVIPSHRPAPAWPANGAIHVRDLVVRYAPHLPPVLKGLTFRVAAREKVGVCGRTGCGKSTLMLALYRIVEPSAGSSIKIDGLEVTTLGLYDLRSKLSLVPQDPVIFSGTVRTNLDPFGTAADFAMWQALQQAGLESAIKAMPNGIDSPLEEGGSNLSVGQRQLLCMARALLKRSTVLLMDEATSNVDNDTDSLIQRTVRTAFKDCTVLTIAHRLATIIDSSKILMLEAGTVAEFDEPQALIKRPGGKFRALVGDASFARVASSGSLEASNNAKPE